MRLTLVLARLAVALLVLAAIIAQLVASVHYVGSHAPGRSGAAVVNFFSYFTIDSNTATVVLLLVAAVVAWRGVEEPGWLRVLRLSVTVYMVITGVVYNLLLRGLAAQGAVVEWSNEVLHVVAPIVVLVDFLVVRRSQRLEWRHLPRVLVFPLVWVVYTLVRGPFATDPYTSHGYWYPYPFLNPHHLAGGYAGVALYVVGITIAFVAVGAGLLSLTRGPVDAPSLDARA